MKKEQKPNIFDVEEFYSSKEYKKAKEEVAAEDPEPREGPEPSDYDPNKFHHSTCQDSKCTSCDRKSHCEVFGEACSMSIQGISICMHSCKYYTSSYGGCGESLISLRKN